MMGTGAVRLLSAWHESRHFAAGESEWGESLLWPSDTCLWLSGDEGSCRRLAVGESERRESQLLRPVEARLWLSGDDRNCSRCLPEGVSVECRESLLRPSDVCLGLSGDEGSCMMGTGAV